MIKYKTNLNCNLNEFHNWNITAAMDPVGGSAPVRVTSSRSALDRPWSASFWHMLDARYSVFLSFGAISKNSLIKVRLDPRGPVAVENQPND